MSKHTKAKTKTKVQPVRIVESPATAHRSKESMEFETEEDMRALKKAQEVLGDKARMKRVESMVKEKTQALEAIMGRGLRQKLKGK